MKRISFIDYAMALMAALALTILLGGCWQNVEAQTIASSDGTIRKTATVCDVDFVFIYDPTGGARVSYHNRDNSGSARVKPRELSGEGDINGTPFDDICLGPGATQEHSAALADEMWIMVEVWWGQQCSPDNMLQPCDENGAVIHVDYKS